MLRKTAPGLYAYLPLAWRVLQKIAQICRDEAEAQDGQEIMLPSIQPAEIWQKSGSFKIFSDIKSYRQLLLVLYQIQNKLCNEIQTGAQPICNRESLLQDVYSFDRDGEGLDNSYNNICKMFCKIFERCGLKCRSILADAGAIGCTAAQEFILMAEAGNVEICVCSSCDYAANLEQAKAILLEGSDESLKACDTFLGR